MYDIYCLLRCKISAYVLFLLIMLRREFADEYTYLQTSFLIKKLNIIITIACFRANYQRRRL